MAKYAEQVSAVVAWRSYGLGEERVGVSACRRIGSVRRGSVRRSRATGVSRLETSVADHAANQGQAANKGQVKGAHGEVAKEGQVILRECSDGGRCQFINEPA